MAHERIRWLEKILLDELKWTPASAIFGLRQVGKTTLMKKIAEKLKATHVTFDDEATLESSKLTPKQFCTRDNLLCIDEVQKGEWIFPTIKSIIGTNRKPGSFLLTGSIRFNVRKEMREALTGRVLTHELLPFCVSEALAFSPSPFLQTLFTLMNANAEKNIQRFADQTTQTRKGIKLKDIDFHLQVGGIPLSTFTRSQARRSAWFKSYLESIIVRDVVLIEPKLKALSLRQGLAFLRSLALLQGSELSYSTLANQTALRLTQVKQLISALEILCVIDLIPPEKITGKSVKALRVEWKDIALRNHAVGLNYEAFASTEIKLMLSTEFRSQLGMASEIINWSYYKSRDGAQIPWIFREGDKALAITFSEKEVPDDYDLRVLKNFLEREKNAFAVFLGSAKASQLIIAPRTLLLPYTAIF